MTRSPAEAEDLVQDVFAKLAGMGAGLLGIRSAGAYLHRIAMHGLTFRELGKATGVTMWTAASRYRLAIERLRTLLGSAR